MARGDTSAEMVPTENHYTFRLAKEFGRTVADMLLGGSHPLSGMEQYLWQRWERANYRLELQAKHG